MTGASKNPAAGPMARALAQAHAAEAAGEVPVGAVLVDGASGDVLAEAHNLVESRADPTAHAELLAIQEGPAQWAPSG